MPGAAHPLNLTGDALTPGAQRSWWLREALDHEDPRPCPPLAADAKADVVIIGGGFSGLWTAYFLTERDPNLGVVVLEQDICGGGPSGRNGGFASGWWDELHGLITLYGREEAVKACRAISSSINALGEFCERHDVDAWFRRGGYMYAITAGAHEKLCEDMVQLARDAAAADELRELTAAEVKARCSSPAFRGGAFMRDGASVQPARLIRGLRRVLLERGVAMHEGTRVTTSPGPTSPHSASSRRATFTTPPATQATGSRRPISPGRRSPTSSRERTPTPSACRWSMPGRLDSRPSRCGPGALRLYGGR